MLLGYQYIGVWCVTVALWSPSLFVNGFAPQVRRTEVVSAPATLRRTAVQEMQTRERWSTRKCTTTCLEMTGKSGDEKRRRICVVGGGFGGLNVALTLASSLPFDPEIVLLDPQERFVFLPLLYELCVDDASLEEVAPTFSSLLKPHPNVRHVPARVTGVDATQNTIYYEDRSESSESSSDDNKKNWQSMEYDAIVIATGATIQLDSIPGASQYALPFYTVQDCYKLRSRFNLLDNYQYPEKKQVVVVGGGFSGVELALNAMERLGGASKASVTLVNRGSEVLQYSSEYNREIGTDRLQKAGITTLTNTAVTEVLPISNIDVDGNDTDTNGKGTFPFRSQVQLLKQGEKESLECDLLLWTAGAQSQNSKTGVLNSILPRDSKGRLVTGSDLKVSGQTNVFALGDCARCRKVPYAATAQVAMQQAPVVAWNVYASLHNLEDKINAQDDLKLLPFQYLALGEMMTLGSDDATISGLEGLVNLSGEAASVLRRLVYAIRMPTPQQGFSAVLESTQRRIQSRRQKGVNTKAKKHIAPNKMKWK